MFLLLAELNASQTATDEVDAILRELSDAAERESGNLVYAVHRELDTQGKFLVYELYKNREACDAHLASTSVQHALAKFQTLLTMPPRIMFCDTIAAKGLASTAA